MNTKLTLTIEQELIVQAKKYAKEMLHESHKAVVDLIQTFSDEELFTKKIFDWTGTTTLGSYCVSATLSHYDWALKKLKAHLKRIS